MRRGLSINPVFALSSCLCEIRYSETINKTNHISLRTFIKTTHDGFVFWSKSY